jgi:DNA polymerase III alpha subunit
MELLFERFLNESRNEWPDIDLDLPSGGERESVIQYLYERYGQLGAAMTANVISYRGRSTAREVGKALGFQEEQIERISSLMGHWEWKGANDGKPLCAGRLRSASSAHCALSRHLPAHEESATPSGAAFGRHGDLRGHVEPCRPH